MKYQRKSLCHQFLATLTAIFLFCNISPASAQTVPEIAEKALASTVYLEMQDSNGVTFGFGSGFFGSVKSQKVDSTNRIDLFISHHRMWPRSGLFSFRFRFRFSFIDVNVFSQDREHSSLLQGNYIHIGKVNF